jgi:hypothetical protein
MCTKHNDDGFQKEQYFPIFLGEVQRTQPLSAEVWYPSIVWKTHTPG